MTSVVHDSLDVDAALLAQLLAPLDDGGDGGAAAIDLASLLLTPDDLLAAHQPPHHTVQGSPATSTTLPSGEESPLSDALLLEESEKLLELLDGHNSVHAEPSAPNSVSAHSQVGSRPFVAGAARSTGKLESAAAGDAAANTSTSATTTTARKPSRRRGSKPGSMRNPSRERLLNELEYLRGQVVHLEEELKSAQDKSGRRAGGDCVTPESSLSMATETAAATAGLGLISPAPTWERIAKRQLAECERAVSENKRLRSMLAAQRQLVAGMEEKLYNWQHATAPGTSSSLVASALSTALPGVPAAACAATESSLKTVRMEPGDDVVFEMLVSELDGLFSQVDEMFRSAGVYALPNKSYMKATVKTESAASGMAAKTASHPSQSSTTGSTDAALRSFVELVEVEVSPFELEMTNRVGTICGERRHELSDAIIYEGSWDPKHTFAEKSRVKRVLNGVEMVFEMLSAAKEFMFDDRLVIVWRNISKCEEHFPDMFVQEFGSFEASRLNLPGGGSSSTLERTVVQFEPKRFTSPSEVVRADGHVMTDMVMSMYRDEMDELDEMMESMLLDESRRSKSSTTETQLRV